MWCSRDHSTNAIGNTWANHRLCCRKLGRSVFVYHHHHHHHRVLRKYYDKCMVKVQPIKPSKGPSFLNKINSFIYWKFKTMQLWNLNRKLFLIHSILQMQSKITHYPIKTHETNLYDKVWHSLLFWFWRYKFEFYILNTKNILKIS